ncbi:MAG: 4-hydroxy-tetrahydrodipicolinate synthase [Gammaproteobacteria bacterium]|nr:4-hydroxy-tetrahydrodipicolinate synthase [Gammaproteobacteria bacterium]|tara:strand:- start:14008 stop:14835 length:828 start_codon:yes stop_codon:yes gene_type:complete
MLKNGDIDFAAFEKLLSFHADARTDGIVLVGTTGESATLNKDERAEIFAFANSKTDIPLMAGVGSSATAVAIQLIECALKNNINECLAVTPYYNKPSQIGLELHYKELSKVGANITLYNVPGRTGVDLLPATIEKLLEIEKVTGIKEAVDTEQRFLALKRLKDKRHDFKLYSGDDPSLVKFMKYKGDGVISVAANVMPKEIKELSDICLAGDFGKAEKIIKNYQEIFKLLFIEASPSPCKYLLEKMSLLENNLRLPLHPLSVEYREKIYEVFKNI